MHLFQEQKRDLFYRELDGCFFTLSKHSTEADSTCNWKKIFKSENSRDDQTFINDFKTRALLASSKRLRCHGTPIAFISSRAVSLHALKTQGCPETILCAPYTRLTADLDADPK